MGKKRDLKPKFFFIHCLNMNIRGYNPQITLYIFYLEIIQLIHQIKYWKQSGQMYLSHFLQKSFVLSLSSFPVTWLFYDHSNSIFAHLLKKRKYFFSPISSILHLINISNVIMTTLFSMERWQHKDLCLFSQ